MKKTLLYLLPFVLLVLSCGREDLKSKKLLGGWQLKKFIVNAEDSTEVFDQQYKNYTISYFDDRSYTYSFVDNNEQVQGATGRWFFSKGTDSLYLDNLTDTTGYKIINLNTNALNLKRVIPAPVENRVLDFQYVRK